tara:strand:- start:358 stop:618 length:261 start_codon:yes stop_codon:yes gene_type:complete
MTIKLSLEEKVQIKPLHRNCKPRKFADRLKAILRLEDGFSGVEVGNILLLDDPTVRKDSNIYLNQGAQDLLQDNNQGRKSCLRAQQ